MINKHADSKRVKAMARNNVVPPHPHIEHFNAHKIENNFGLVRSTVKHNPTMDHEYQER